MKSLNDAQALALAASVADMLARKPNKDGLYPTSWGTKTALGLGRSLARAYEVAASEPIDTFVDPYIADQLAGLKVSDQRFCVSIKLNSSSGQSNWLNLTTKQYNALTKILLNQGE
jgi:hypothetical protein